MKEFFQRLSPIANIALSLVIALLIGSVFVFVGSVLSMPLFGIDTLGNPSWMNNTANPQVLGALKFIQAVSAIGMFAVPAFVLASLLGEKSKSFLGLRFNKNALTYLVASGFILAAIPLINGMAALNELVVFPDFLAELYQWFKATELRAAELTELLTKMNSPIDLFVTLVIVAVIPAVAEELLFRGYLLNVLLRSKWNHHIAIWLIAAVFSALHGQFFGFLPRLVLGAVLGYFYWYSGSLWVAILAHFINNGFAVLTAYCIQNQMVSESWQTIGSNSSDWLYVLISLICTLLLLAVFIKKLSISRVDPSAASSP